MSKFLKYLILIWWCYARGKLWSKSNYHKRIWILNLLYVNLFVRHMVQTILSLTYSDPNSSWAESHIFIELAEVEVHFYVKICFRHSIIFFIISCSWIGKEHVKKSLIIYRNYALLCVGFMKYFNWDVFYIKQFLWYLENCLFNIRIYNCWKRICSATNYEILPFKGWFYK